jgi:Zn-dependent protease
MNTNLSISYILAAIVTLVVSLVLHEFMHGYVAYLLGDTTAKYEGRLTLNPLQHIDPFMTVLLPVITLLAFGVPVLAAKPVPFNPSRLKYDEFGAALVAAAGPLTNLALAFIAAVVANNILGTVPSTQTFLGVFIVLNVAIFVFNMIPIPPLDGSRVLYAFAPEPLQDFMSSIEPYGLILIFGLVLLGGFGGTLTHINQIILNHLP